MQIIKIDALNSQTKYVAVCKLISPLIDASAPTLEWQALIRADRAYY